MKKEEKGIEIKVANDDPIRIPEDAENYHISRIEYAPGYEPTEGQPVVIEPLEGKPFHKGLKLRIEKVNLKYGLSCCGVGKRLEIVDFRGDVLIIDSDYLETLVLNDVSVRHLMIMTWVEYLNLEQVETQHLETGGLIDNIERDAGRERAPIGRPITIPLRVSHLIQTEDAKFAHFARLMCPTTPILFAGNLERISPTDR